MELLFDIEHSPSLSAQQREQLLQRLAGQVDNDGVLRIVVTSERNQLRNRQEAITRFALLLKDALRRQRRRIPTAPSVKSMVRRAEQKRQRSRLKQKRRRLEPVEMD